jgi:hypothetical protein
MRRDLEESNRERLEALRRVVNDPNISISNDEQKCINCDETLMMPDGELVKRRRSGIGSGAFAQQFSVLRGQLPKVKKVARKKSRRAIDKLQSQAFKEANKRLRTTKGQLKKGKTQRDVAILAQRILRKLRK